MPAQQAEGWHLFNWLNVGSCMGCNTCGHERLEQAGHVKVGADTFSWCGVRDKDLPPPAAVTCSRPLKNSSVLAVEDCCSPRWHARCEPLCPEDGSPQDGCCRNVSHIWDVGKAESAEDFDSVRWAEQEPDPEQLPVNNEDNSPRAEVCQTEITPLSKDVAEMRQLAIELFERHEGAGSKVPLAWAEEHTGQLFTKYVGLERELYTRLCRKYGEVPVAKYADTDDPAIPADNMAERCRGREEPREKQGKPMGQQGSSGRRRPAALQSLMRQGSAGIAALLAQAKQGHVQKRS